MSRGFFAKLTPEQQQAALEYRGPENIGGQTMTRTFTDEELDALAWVLRAGGPCPEKCRDMSPAGGCACGNAALAAGLRERDEARAEIERLRGALEHIAQYPGPHADEAAHWRAEAARAALAPATPPAHKDAAP